MHGADGFIKSARDALARGDWGAATRALRAALCCAPERVDGLYNLAVLLGRSSDFGGAEKWYRHALVGAPGHEGAAGNLADTLLSLSNEVEAERVCVVALAASPLSARLLGNLALIRIRRGDLARARRDLVRALCVDPGQANAWHTLGLQRHDEPELADAAYVRAWLSGNRDVGILVNRGEIAQRTGRISEAIAFYNAARERAPSDPDIVANLASANVDDGDFDAARDNARMVLSAHPDHRLARWISSWVCLAHRDFETGYRAYDDPWRSPERDAHAHATRYTLWDGGQIDGALLLWCTQGLGDEILYAGMIDDVLALGVQVILETDPRLVPLFQRSWPKVTVTGRGDPLPSGIVAQSSTLRLPMYFRRSVQDFPARRSYLVADVKRVEEYRATFGGAEARKSVGLSWRSGNQRTGSAKSTELSDWSGLLSLADLGFVSLQYDDGGETDPRVGLNPGPDVKDDIDGLAAQIAALDHVVSISGVVAHLAGALGTSGHVLLPPAPLWYWFAEGMDCPWYPSLTLLRRSRGEPWPPAVERVAGAVGDFLDIG
jgi:tetratricopeptide (TPR) repeat protein